MKYRIITMLFSLFAFVLNAQKAITVSGGEAVGSGGTVSYSVGQIAVYSNSDSNYTIVQGVQQAFNESTLSILDVNNLAIKVYPNPSTDYLVINLNGNELGSLDYTLRDLHGRIVLGGKLNQNQTQFGMNTFSSGIYTLSLSNKSKIFKTFKIIKN